MKLIFCGHGRAGKDEAGLYLASITNLKFAGTCSNVLARHVAERLGVSEEEAWKNRHSGGDELRLFWRKVGDEIRKDDPAVICREMMAKGELGGGIRGLEEIRAARAEGLADLFIWVANNRVPVDPTVEYGEEECDLIIPNHWDLTHYHHRLRTLAYALKIVKAETSAQEIIYPRSKKELTYLAPHKQERLEYLARINSRWADALSHAEQDELEQLVAEANNIALKNAQATTTLASGLTEKGQAFYAMYEKRFGRKDTH